MSRILKVFVQKFTGTLQRNLPIDMGSQAKKNARRGTGGVWDAIDDIYYEVFFFFFRSTYIEKR